MCLKQGQSMGRAAPPQPGIHRVPPSPGGARDFAFLI